MRNKKKYAFLAIILGIVLINATIIGRNFAILEIDKVIFGVLIGVGSGLLGAGIGTIFNIVLIEKNPELKKKQEIEQKDERNIFIYTYSKAASFNFTTLAFPIIVLTQILIDKNLIITILLVLLYLIMQAVKIYYFYKLRREL